MGNQVNIGIVSTSWWAEIAFLPALQADERVILQAICGRNQERAGEIAGKFGIKEVYADYRDMIAQSNLDAVIVASPDDLHYEMVMAVLDAGLHVLCEKPIAMDANHALEMLKKAEEKAVKHLVMYTWHWLPVFQKAKRYIDDNFVGSMYHATFNWQINNWRSNDYTWRVDGKRSNGIVADLGSHLFHLASWLMGDIVAVTARLATYGKHDSPDDKPLIHSNDSAFVILEFESGAMAQVTTSSVSNILQSDKGVWAELQGKDGSLGLGFKFTEEGFEQTFNAGKDGEDEQEFEQSMIDLPDFFKTNPVGVRYFIDCVLDEAEMIPSFKEGYQIQKVIDAAKLSHETGKRIQIDT